MEGAAVNPDEILNIETSYPDNIPHTNNTSNLLNIAYLHNLIDRKPNNNVKICERTMLNEYKTHRDNSSLNIYLQNSNNNIKDILARKPTNTEIYTAISSQKTTRQWATTRYLWGLLNAIHTICKYYTQHASSLSTEPDLKNESIRFLVKKR